MKNDPSAAGDRGQLGGKDKEQKYGIICHIHAGFI